MPLQAHAMRFSGVRILPKGSEFARKDSPVNPKGEDLSKRPDIETLKAPYIVEQYNAPFKQSVMLAYNFAQDPQLDPHAFLFEGLPILDMGNGKKHWLIRNANQNGNNLGRELTKAEFQLSRESQYRIIDGDDAYRFIDESMKSRNAALDRSLLTTKKMLQAPGAIFSLLENLWFRNERSLGERISTFIAEQKQRHAQGQPAILPVEESSPKTFLLE